MTSPWPSRPRGWPSRIRRGGNALWELQGCLPLLRVYIYIYMSTHVYGWLSTLWSLFGSLVQYGT